MGNSNIHSKEEIEEEKKKFLTMKLEDKRRFYGGFKHVTLDDILPWTEYYKQKITSDERVPSSRHRYAPDPQLNCRISLFNGDITTLEIDALVNSAANPEKGGEVNTAIMGRAGEYFKDEILLRGLAEAGEVLVTGGYRLPAKYIINTLAPRSQDSAILLNCYRNSLEAAKKMDITTIAFPCIATRKKNAFQVQKAAELVLTTVRNWLQNNYTFVERIIFCVYKREDADVYRRVIQEFFPIAEEELKGDTSNQRQTLFPGDEDEEEHPLASQHRYTLGACAMSDTLNPQNSAANGEQRPYTTYLTGNSSRVNRLGDDFT